MTTRRTTAAVSTILLVLLSVALAEAALLVLLLVFSSILRLQLQIENSPQYLRLPDYYATLIATPTFTVHQAGMVFSALCTATCGAGAAVWRYRRWRSS
jgi:heme/copper-type cytochrome/quinol oxidase subunit 1